jgi:hypothetical protein
MVMVGKHVQSRHSVSGCHFVHDCAQLGHFMPQSASLKTDLQSSSPPKVGLRFAEDTVKTLVVLGGAFHWQ